MLTGSPKRVLSIRRRFQRKVDDTDYQHVARSSTGRLGRPCIGPVELIKNPCGNENRRANEEPIQSAASTHAGRTPCG
jgi:hypothetical protein